MKSGGIVLMLGVLVICANSAFAVDTGWVLWLKKQDQPNGASVSVQWEVLGGFNNYEACQKTKANSLDSTLEGATLMGTKAEVIPTTDGVTGAFFSGSGKRLGTFSHTYFCLPGGTDPR